MTRRTLAYLACQTAGWSLWASATLVMFALSNEPIEVRTFAWAVLGAVVGFSISHAYRAVLRRGRWTAMPMRGLAPRAIAASIVCGLALDLWVFAISYVTKRPGEPDLPLDRLPVFLFNFTILFLGWSLIYFSVHWLERSRNADRAQLAALKSQLNPHFLFNALNSVRGLVTEDPSRAQAAITRLAKLLRAALGTTATETVTLARELEVVDDYLALEAVRLEHRLRVTLDIADDARDAQVPALLVQTLVENAIKHGIARRRDGGEVSVCARIADRMLAIDVANTAADAAPEQATGVGLANASERLQLLFGPRASLQLDRSDRTRTVAHARIPLP
jgi:two-component system, LytTR family, sensor histidine kinase AlgZ